MLFWKQYLNPRNNLTGAFDQLPGLLRVYPFVPYSCDPLVHKSISGTAQVTELLPQMRLVL